LSLPCPTTADGAARDATASRRPVIDNTRIRAYRPSSEVLPRSRDGAFLCAFITLLAVLATRPVLEMGTTDDWSYARTALDLARTGHIIYNGWATAMLGWQIFWGALVIKLFGFSFFALRLSTSPFAMGTAYILHQICVRLGLNARNAVLATLTVVLSPLFLPLVTSFMTDVPAFFWLLVTLYACIRATSAESRRACILWLAFAASSNVVAGTARQIVWLGALVMVPSAALLARKWRGVLPAAAALWAGSFIAIASCMYWFHLQPYSIPEKVIGGDFTLALLPHLLQQVRDLLLTILLLSLPALAAYFVALRSNSKKVFFALFGAAVLILSVRVLTHGARAFAPWMPYVVTEYGVGGSGSWENLGQKATVLAPWIRALLTCTVLAAACAWLATWLPRLRTIRSEFSEWQRGRFALSQPDRCWITLAVLLGPFTAAYCTLLIPRATFNLGFDRYLVPLIAIFVIVILRYFQDSFLSEPPRLCFALLVLFSAYGVAATHDYFSTGRARLSAAALVRSAGIPRTEIQGGWEYDGWTQVSTAGYINEPRIELPAGAYKPINRVAALQPACRFDFAQLTPAIDPRYFVVFSPQSCLAASHFPPVAYHTWLPPFHRNIYIQQLPSQN